MKKYLFLTLIFFMTCAKTFALEIVYPKSNPCTINAGSTFFIGSVSSTETLKINDVDVKVSPSGAFAQYVPLNIGKNDFKIETENSSPSPLTPHTSLFTIIRPQPTTTNAKQTLVEYPVMTFYTIKDNVPLRTTPVDGGINRMSHLPKRMQLSVNGEQNGFYRVYLNSKTVGWIDKSSVKQITETKNVINNPSPQPSPPAEKRLQNQDLEPPLLNPLPPWERKNPQNDCEFNEGSSPVKLKKAKCKLTHEFYEYEFEFERKTPFTIREENGITFEIFNVQGCEDNTLTFKIPVQKLVGYDAFWEGEHFMLKIRRTPIIDCTKPLKGIRIAVDAGHGGNEAGAVGCCGEREKTINLAIAQNLQQELKSRGAEVFMTRETDVDVPLLDRVKFAREKNVQLLISIHANALPDGADPNKNKGTSVYYYNNQAKSLAESILTSMTTELGTQNDKVRQGSLALTRPTASVSVLIEVAYMINPDDYALLTDKCFQFNCAKAVADGIEGYLKK